MPFISIVETPGRPSQYVGAMAVAALGSRQHFAMPPKKTARFPRAARLLRHADFERVYKLGRRHFSASMTVFYLARPDAGEDGRMAEKTQPRTPAPHSLRVGFTVGRALGGAVQRNRMKRRLREAVRLSRPAEGVAADVVINPKKSLLATDFSAVINEVSRAFVIIEQKLSGKAAPESRSDKGAGGRKPEAESRS